MHVQREGCNIRPNTFDKAALKVDPSDDCTHVSKRLKTSESNDQNMLKTVQMRHQSQCVMRPQPTYELDSTGNIKFTYVTVHGHDWKVPLVAKTIAQKEEEAATEEDRKQAIIKLKRQLGALPPEG